MRFMSSDCEKSEFYLYAIVFITEILLIENVVVLLEKESAIVYNVFMDSMSLEYLTVTRRKLHKLAEVSGEEYKTSAFIVEELKRFGYKPKTIGTGVYCDIGRGSPRLALRADIDALPIIENVAATGMKEYAAENAMHACGHDGHTANLLNVARLLGENHKDCKVPLRLIFQFGEEGIGGSAVMIENGVLDGVDEIYALHLCPELEIGKIGYCYGGMFAGCCEFDVDIFGVAAHCAMKELGADAVASSIDVANKLTAAADKLGLLLNLGKITGGAARNIVADSCKSEYTLRYYDTAKCEMFMMDAERALLGADEKFGTTHKLVTNAVYPSLINHALCVDKARKAAGDRAVEMKPRLTAEDFSNYLLHVPGCMVWLGVKSEGHGKPLHSDEFSFDESALTIGTEYFMNIIGMHGN